jgi:hypothetical protein
MGRTVKPPRHDAQRDRGEYCIAKVTKEGADFLKAATASPDFSSLDLEGIPDGYTGPTVTRKEFITTNITALAGNQTYVLITPTGGVAFWSASEPTIAQIHSGSVFTPFLTPDATQLFGGVGYSGLTASSYAHPNTSYVTQGRMMSCAAELNCLNNAFNQYGSIAVFKTPLTYERSVSLAPQAGVLASVNYTGSAPIANPIGGCQALSSQTLNGEAYVRPVRDGAYSVSMSHEREFEWRDVNDGEEMKTVHLGPLDFPGDVVLAGPLPSIHFNGPIPLWDNSFDTIVMRIEVPEGVVDQSFIVSVWKTFEYKPAFNSLLYTVARESPARNDATLRVYSAIERELPTAVPSKDNPNFWESILSTVNSVSGVLSAMPGQIGTVAKGAHAVTSLLVPARKRASPSLPAARKKRTVTTTRKKGAPLRKKKGARKKRR